MNTRKVKLGLTIDLLNGEQNAAGLRFVKELMQRFRKEVGIFINSTIVRKMPVTNAIENRTYALQYENCVLNVDLIYNKANKRQYVNGFQLI